LHRKNFSVLAFSLRPNGIWGTTYEVTSQIEELVNQAVRCRWSLEFVDGSTFECFQYVTHANFLNCYVLSVIGPGAEFGTRAPRFPPWSVFVIFFTLSFVAIACWSFASPLGAAPDEQAHIIRAEALDHAQMGTKTSPDNRVLVTVRVPESINEVKYWMTCWQFHAVIPASCSPDWPTSEKLVFTTTHVGHYPPLYYALVGTGSFVSRQRSGIYAMRIVSAGMSAFMLALCAYAVAKWSRRRYIVVGIFVSLTPITLFLASTVNPSGFEIVAAICLWTLAIILALDYPSNPPKGLVVLIGATASVLALVRGLSPLWVTLVALSLAVLVGFRQVLHLFRARRDVRVTTLVVAVTGVVAALWIFTQGTLNVLPSHVAIDPEASEVKTLRLVANHGYQWLHEGVGVLGWLDTPMPLNLYRAWYLLLAIVLVVALVHANWRHRTWMITLCVMSYLIPVLIISHQAKADGIVWQGRDGMPLAAGALILAGAMWGHRTDRAVVGRVVASLIVATVSGLELFAFYINLRRYAVGINGPRLFFLHHQGWSPPTGQLLTLVVYAVAVVALATLMITWICSPKVGLLEGISSINGKSVHELAIE
jgi:general stress protein CsbA